MNSTTQALNVAAPLRVGATGGKVKALLRWEALLIMIGAIIVYANLSGRWEMFALLLLVPDLSTGPRASS